MLGLTMDPVRRILVFGYFGFGNTGDEAILATMVDGLRRHLPTLSIAVTSGDPESTHATQRVEAVGWKNIVGLVSAARECDVIVLGSGGLLQDYWGVDTGGLLSPQYAGLSFFGSAMLLAELLGKPLMLFAVGVGPLITDEGRRFTRLVCDRASVVSVRDVESRRLLEEIGVAVDDVHVTADPVFQLAPPRAEEGRRLLASSRVNLVGNRRLIVVVRQWDVTLTTVDWQAPLVETLDELIEEYAIDVVLLPFQRSAEHLSDDSVACEEILGRMRHAPRVTLLTESFSVDETASIVAACDGLLGMRLHSLIMAAVAGVPAVGIAYDPKVSNAMRALGRQDGVLELEELQVSALLPRLLACLDAPPEERESLRTAARDLRKRAEETNRLLTELLSTPRVPSAASEELLELLRTVLLRRVLDVPRLQGEVERLAREAEELGRAREEEVGHLLDEKRELQARIDRAAEEAAVLRRRLVDAKRRRADLQAEREALASDLEESAAERRRLGEELARVNSLLQVIVGSRAWRVTQGMWRLGLLFRRARALPRAGMRKLLGLGLISWYEYAFVRFKQGRNAFHGSGLSRVRCPTDQSLVSVILPVYNGGDLVREAIDSVLAQTYRHFELIAIDDGSTDGTAAILEEYARRDDRVRVLRQENRKLPRTLTRGFSLARGQFHTWTSADNRLKPDFLERMVACLERNSDWDMAYANFEIIGEDGLPLTDSWWYRDYQVPKGSATIQLPHDTAAFNVWPNNFVGAAFLYRDRVSWLLGEYSRHRFTTEDYDYFMRVNALLKLCHADFDDPVYEYRFHSKSLTARDEELGITRGRTKLMVWEDFRRDFHLTPLLWDIDGPGERSPTLRALRDRIGGAGHVEWSAKSGPGQELPRLWLPRVLVRVAGTAGPFPSPPESGDARASLRVLVIEGGGDLPTRVEEGWDLCVAVGDDASVLPRLEGAYRGWLGVPNSALLFSVLDVRAREKHLAALEAEVEMPSPATLKISVIICTYQRSERLAWALGSVARQTFPSTDYEVVVVDNNPQDIEVGKQIDELCTRQWRRDAAASCRKVSCPLPGLSHARNAGISVARGEILCFLDDDAVANEDWLERVWESFEAQPKLGVMGGHIVLAPPEPRPEVISPGWERYWSHFVTGYNAVTVLEHWWEFPWGANWCARRKTLVEIGGFRTRYGRHGNDFSGGEEIIAACLAKQLGFGVGIAPRSEVRHAVDAARFSFEHVRRTIIAGNLVNYQAQRDLYLPMEATVWRTLRLLLSPSIDRTVGANSLRSRVRHWLYRREAWLRLLRIQLLDLRRRVRRRGGQRC